MKVLVTGFEPFGGDAVNPSAEIARHLPHRVGDARIATAVLPVVYYESLVMLGRLLALQRPDAVLCLGLAGGARAVTLETRAVNLNDAPIPDNDGRQPRGEPIRPGGEAALPPTLPLSRIFRSLRRLSVPADSSQSAGTFLCNHVFYGLMHHIHHDDPSVMGGFIHVPFIAEQLPSHPAEPFFELDTLVQGIREAVLTIQE